MKYLYISNRTREKIDLSKAPSQHILFPYKIIKTSSRNPSKSKPADKKWGMFVLDTEKKELIGVCQINISQEDGIPFLLLGHIYIEESYRKRQLGYELVKRTILKILQQRKSDKNKNKNKTLLIKVVIAGGEPVFKCLIKVFQELKFKVFKYQSDQKEEIRKLKPITFAEALKIEKRNVRYDRWQTLFFSHSTRL